MLGTGDLVKHFMALRILTVLLNHIVNSPLVSAHYLVILLTLVPYTTIAVKAISLGLEIGIFFWGFILALVTTSVLILYGECALFGDVFELSAEFLGKCARFSYRSKARRKSYFYLFIRSCPRVEPKIARPFFRLTKSTFADFVDRSLDLLVTLLVSTAEF